MKTRIRKGIAALMALCMMLMMMSVTVFAAAPIQLTIENPTLTLSKLFDGSTTAAVTAGTLSGVVAPDEVIVSAVATYDTRTVGTNKTITVVYTLAGSDAGQYIKPVDFTVDTGEITALQLTITSPTLTLVKAYDGNTIAAVTPGALSIVVAPDAVTVSAVATYNTAAVGTNKVITVAFTLAGANAANYIKPVNYVVTTGAAITFEMTALTAAITAEVGAVHTSPVYKLTQTDYTASSWAAYTDKIAAAIVVEADVNATQSEVDTATTAIGTSKTELVRAYTLNCGVETSTGGAGHTRTITIGGANAGSLAGKYLVVQFTQGAGNAAKVSVVMISPVSTNVTVSYQVGGTAVEAWLTGGMPDLVAPNMGVVVYANITTH